MEEDTYSDQLKNKSVCPPKHPKSNQSAATGFTIALLYLLNLSFVLCTQRFQNCSEMAQLEMALDSLCYTLAETMGPKEKKIK